MSIHHSIGAASRAATAARPVEKYLLMLAWFAGASIAALPALARWLDPAPVLEAPQGVGGTVWFVLEVATATGQHAWLLPLMGVLCAAGWLLPAAVFAVRMRRGTPWTQRRACIWAGMVVTFGLLVAVLLDDYRP